MNGKVNHNEQRGSAARDLLLPAGVLLLISGGSILLDQRLHTGWLSQTVIILSGLIILIGGIVTRFAGGILAGALLTSLSAGGFFLLGAPGQPWDMRLGGFLTIIGASWLLVFAVIAFSLRRPHWWMLVPGGLLGGLGACFLFSPLRVFDFVLYAGVGLAFPLLTWGAFRRMIGLIIPGSLLLGVSVGVYSGWAGSGASTPLANTGIMLVFFGLGWLLITVLSRVAIEKAVWWPLIPGGTLAVVGWGLYIGGNPSNALSFISNTGSIALIMLGLYLLLLRKGLR